MRTFWRFYFNLQYALRWRKPRLLLRLTNQLARALLCRGPRLRYVDFALDFTCNQHCQHCFARSYDHQQTRGRDLISAAQYRSIAQQALELGAVSFSIQGGEPLAMMRKTLVLLSCLPVEKTLVSIKTNGTLLTPRRAAELAAAGVDIVTVSLDSGDPTEHDTFRGMRNAYRLTLRGILAAKQAGLKVIVACTISHANAGSAPVLRLIEKCRKWGVLFFIVKAAPSGNWAGNTEILLTEEDSRWIDMIVAHYPHCRTDFEANFFRYGCGAMKEIIYIDQYGNLMPCPFIQVAYGNVLKEPLARIRERALAQPEYADYAQKCLIAEDPEFLDRYLAVTGKGAPIPVPAKKFHAID